MGSILSLISSPVSTLVNSVSDVISKFITTPEQKLQAQEALLKLQSDFQLSLLKADSDFATQQASVVKAEVQSQSWMARNWRPILMLTFTFIVAYNFIIAPLFSRTTLPLPDQLWELLKIGMGGYIFGRSAEKIVSTAAPQISAAFQNKNTPAS